MEISMLNICGYGDIDISYIPCYGYLRPGVDDESERGRRKKEGKR